MRARTLGGFNFIHMNKNYIHVAIINEYMAIKRKDGPSKSDSPCYLHHMVIRRLSVDSYLISF